MEKQIVSGFLDESPSLHDKAYFFCVDILTTTEEIKNNLRKIIKNARQKIVKKKLKSLTEIKFNNSDEKTRIYVLKEIAKWKVDIIVYVIDKENRRVDDTPENYGIVVGGAITESLRLGSAIKLTADKKYTSFKQQNEFLTAAQNTISRLFPTGANVFFNSLSNNRQ